MHTSINVIEELKSTMAPKLRADISPLSATCCIFRVPQLLRRHNEGAYGPDIIAIGPFHPRGDEQFKSMENVKQWYLHNLLLRKSMSLETLMEGIDKFKFHDQKEGIIEFEKRARKFYAEAVRLSQNEFIEMMVLDGCFIVELFRKSYDEKQRDMNDPVFNMDCTFQYLCHDLLLLENQLPWFVLQCLYSLTLDTYDDPSFRKLMLTVFTSHPPLAHNSRSYLRYLNDHSDDQSKILHILDLVRSSIVFSIKDLDETNSGSKTKRSNKWLRIARKRKKDTKLVTELMHPATALSEAGIDFRRALSDIDSIMSIDFNNGVLTIPELAIGELTESLFRNLIAFEQCYRDCSHKITSYAVLMDNLIASNKDMEFLCEKKIIGNWLSIEDASQFFNKLYNDTLLKEFYYAGLCAQLNLHYEGKWNKWQEKFKRNYFSDPWKVTSLVAGCILLVLTLLQTSYTIKQYYSPQK